ncbi:adrenocorticotropic hormone receptor-like [Dermacentor albipictus]|uniref:adrenocorticotropic hormone receptor-like n=1 Tax=Dermacentor albipictus TaxID=60249 RepID=UPI0031FCBAD7
MESNGSVPRWSFGEDQRAVYAIAVPVLLVGCSLAFVFNAGVLLSLRWLRRPVSPTLCFSLSLTFADAYSALLLATGLVLNSYLPVYGVSLGSQAHCIVLVLEVFRLSGLLASAFHLLALAVNHYVGILRPLHYAAMVTRQSSELAIAVLWALPVLVFLVYFASVPGQGLQSPGCVQVDFVRGRAFSLTLLALFSSPLAVMTFIYSHIFVIIRRHRAGLVSFPSARQLNRNVKAAYTTLWILGTYLVGWMPAVAFIVLTCTDCALPIYDLPMRTRMTLGILTNALIISKGLIDPFIYAARMFEVKEALQNMLHCRPRSTKSMHRRSLLATKTDTLTSSLRMIQLRRESFIVAKPRPDICRCSRA